jgi:lipoprotein-releasing system permease protein
MHWPFEVLIGLRYLRAKRRNGFISFISLISIVGIALGVAALIIVLSVMNGFQKEIRGRILSVASHVEISAFDGRLPQWQSVAKVAERDAHVLAAAPFVNGQGLFSAYGNVRGGLVRGIEPVLEDKVVDVGRHMVRGKLEALSPAALASCWGWNWHGS